MPRTLLEVDQISKRFCRNRHRKVGFTVRDIASDLAVRQIPNRLRAEEFWALRDVSFRVNAGQVIGVIGQNGAGKSTLINLVMGMLRPTSGKVILNTNKVVMMTHNGNLDSMLSGRENIVDQLALHGMPRHLLAETIEAAISFSELGDSIDAPVGTYSLGMRLRLSFAIYTRLRPDLFVVDEALNGGDLAFQRKFQSFLDAYVAQGGSILLASHDLYTIQSLCHQCILIDQGEVTAIGPPQSIIHTYLESTARRKPLNSGKSEQLPLFDTGRATAQQGASSNNLALGRDDAGRKFSGSHLASVINFESIEVTASGGGALKSGCAVEINIVYQSQETFPEAGCGIEIGNAEVFPIATLGTSQIGVQIGRNTLRCSVGALVLVPGVYRIAVSLVDISNGSVLGTKGYTDIPISFEIVGEPDHCTNIARWRKSFLQLDSVWTTDD